MTRWITPFGAEMKKPVEVLAKLLNFIPPRYTMHFEKGRGRFAVSVSSSSQISG